MLTYLSLQISGYIVLCQAFLNSGAIIGRYSEPTVSNGCTILKQKYIMVKNSHTSFSQCFIKVFLAEFPQSSLFIAAMSPHPFSLFFSCSSNKVFFLMYG